MIVSFHPHPYASMNLQVRRVRIYILSQPKRLPLWSCNSIVVSIVYGTVHISKAILSTFLISREVTMSNNKILSAICYFSIFFSPLLLPAIVYFVTDDYEVKGHAKKSLISHLAPIILLIVGFVLFWFSMVSFETRMTSIVTGGFDFWAFAPLIFMGVYGLLFLVVVIWNVYQGVKVLK